MIGTVIYANWLSLKRDKVALALSFILPIIFFTIFASIFGGMGGDEGTVRKIQVIVVNEDGSPFSEKLITALAKQDALEIVRQQGDPPTSFSRDSAAKAVRDGVAPVALVLPKGFSEGVGSFVGGGTPIVLLHDPSNPMARHTVNGLLQSCVMTAAPDLMMNQGLATLQQFGGPLTDRQQQAVSTARGMMSSGGDSGNSGSLIQVDMVDARADASKDKDDVPDIIAYYAAGIGVMFLLFSMVGVGGSLLEEEETGTLDRLLCSRLGMNRLLLGKWLFASAMGYLQLFFMFCWGALVYGLTLFTVKHLSLFLCFSLVMATAAGSFGILLATLSKSRAQLSGMSTVLILIMSALGGSMVPRFAMPSYMDITAKFTLNGWGIDGYQKIFWREDPSQGVLQGLVHMLPEVGVLCAMTLVFLGMAMYFAKRWQPV